MKNKILFLVLLLGLFILPSFVFAESNAVYLDGTNGSDINDGTSAETAVATYEKAVELASSNNTTTIYVTGTINITSGSYTWNDSVSLIRDESFTTGALIELNGGSLTLSNITVDGASISVKYPLIMVTDVNSILTINNGTTIKNNVNTNNNLSSTSGAVNVSAGSLVMNGGTITANSGYWGGGVTVFGGTNTTTFTMNGGTISYNSAENGGGVLLYGNTTFYMYGGNVDYNTAVEMGGGLGVWSGSTAYIYAGSISNNATTKIYTSTGSNSFGGGGIYINGSASGFGAGTCYLYNVELTGNSNTTTAQPSLRSVITACGTGNVKIYVTDGSVIHDNDKTAVYDIVLYSSSGADFNVTPIMLGGASYDWHTVGRINASKPATWETTVVGPDSLINSSGTTARYGTVASTTDGTVTGLDRVSTYVNNNSSGGWGAAIGCNGNLIIGKDDGNVKLNIEKEWNVEDETSIPDSIDVSVIATDSQGYVADLGIVTLTKENDWQITIDGLPKYDTYGGIYTYTLVETTEEYFVTISSEELDDGDSDSNTVEYQYTIVNTVLLDLTIEKEVEGESTDSSYEFEIKLETDFDEDGEYELYNGTIDIIDVDGNSSTLEFVDGVATITLKESESITLMLAYQMRYTITEGTNSANYTTYTVNGENEVVATEITNQILSDTTILYTNIYSNVTIDIEKNWKANEESIPESIEVYVIRTDSDGNQEIVATITLSAEDEWKATITGLSKYDSNGNKYTYSIEEETLDRYVVEISSEEIDDGDSDSNTVEYQYTIVNTALLDLTIEKDVEGESTDSSYEFEIKLETDFDEDGEYELYNGTIDIIDVDGNSSTLEFVDGVATITLKESESITLMLAYQMRYTITEGTNSANYTTWTINGITTDIATWDLTEDTIIVFTNTYVEDEETEEGDVYPPCTGISEENTDSYSLYCAIGLLPVSIYLKKKRFN